jgi:hypothetical protein
MIDGAAVEIDLMFPAFEELRSHCFFDSPTIDEDVRAQVCELLLAAKQPGYRVERRNSKRYPYPHLVRLSPVGSDGRTPVGTSIVVAGRTLSEGGFGFYHPEPLSYRRVIASFHLGNGRWVGFLMDLPWCRFTTEGWYESGGRFLEAVPVAEPPAATMAGQNRTARQDPTLRQNVNEAGSESG